MQVLVSVMPLSGHVGPLTGLVQELVRRGHHVRVYTGSRHVAPFEALGAEPVVWSRAPDFDETDLAATFPGVEQQPGLLRVLKNIETMFIQTAPAQCRDLIAELDRAPADVLISDIVSYGGSLTGELTGQPWVTVSVIPFTYPSRRLPPPGMPMAPARGVLGRGRDRILWSAMNTMTRSVDRTYNAARAEVGLPPVPHLLGPSAISPWLTLATGPPSIEWPNPDSPDHVHFVGRLTPSLSARPGATVPPARGDGPRIVITQGTYNVDPTELLQPALLGLAGAPMEVWATSGVRGRLDLGFALPDNARLVDFLDFRVALPTTDVLITNGGWGGVLAGLAAGVPMVVAGADVDKPEIAARISRSGAGIDLGTHRPSPRAVSGAVGTILADPSYRRRAQDLSAELAALGGSTRAAELIERLVESGRPVLD